MLTCITAAVAAQSKEEVKDSSYNPLKEVVVTAQRHAQPAVTAPFSVSTVSKQQIDDFGPRTTPEALMGTTGVFIQKTNHGGGSPFVRGLTGNQTLILVDGIRLNNSTFRYGPNQYLNTIDPFIIHRIEVAKGTGSVQYGSDAIGGVVHILTQDPQFAADKPKWGGKVAGRYMTGDMEKTVRGDAKYSGEKFAFTAGLSKRSFGDLIGGDTTGKQLNSGYEEWAFDAKAKFALKQNMQLTVASQFLRQQDVPVYHKYKLENFALNMMDPQQRFLNYAKLNIQGKSSLLKEIELIGSWQQTIERRHSRKNGSSTETHEFDKINTLGLTFDIYSSISKNWTANSGIELYHDRVNSSKYDLNTRTAAITNKRGLYPDDSKYGNYSIYSLHHFTFSKLIVEAGARFNAFDIRISDTTLGNVKVMPSALVGNAALMYKVSKGQTLYTAFSSGFRAPNVDDMGTLGIVDFRYEVPASDLKPEKSQHTEIGYKLQTAKAAFKLAAYYMHLSNIITRVRVEGQTIENYPVHKKENTESAYIKGFETELNLAVTSRIDFQGGVTYAYGQSLSKHEPMRRIPPFHGRALGRYASGKWFAAAEFQFAASQKRLAKGDKDDNRIPAGGTPAWQVLNFFGGYKFSKLHINAAVQNIFNEDYRTHGSGINGVGRSAWLSLSLVL